MARGRRTSAARKRSTPIRKRWWWRGGARAGRFTGRVTAKGVRRGSSAAWRAAQYALTEQGRAKSLARLRLHEKNRRRWTPARADLGRHRCLGCGADMDYRRGRVHVCKEEVATPRRAQPRPPQRPTTGRSTGGRIVRKKSTAAAIAAIEAAEITDILGFEQVAHATILAILQLGATMEGLAEKIATAGLDPRVVAAAEELGVSVTELVEPARKIRHAFRVVYGPVIVALESGVRMPANPDFFKVA